MQGVWGRLRRALRRRRRAAGRALERRWAAFQARLVERVAARWRRIERRLPAPVGEVSRDLIVYFSDPQRRFRRYVLASVTLHLVLVMVITASPLWTRNRRWETPPLLVSLVTLPEPEPPKPGPRRERPRPQPTKEAPRLEEKKAEAPKLKEKPAPKKEKPAPKQEEPAPQQTAVEPEPAPPEKTERIVTAQVDEAAFTYDYYLQILVAKISQAWMPPQGADASGEPPAAVLSFRINRDGRVNAPVVEEPSASRFFDRSAQDAILRAQPFPPLPPRYGGRWLTVHLRFVLSGSRMSETG
jgi:TonB family protein